MPCDSIQTSTVEFKMERRDLILKAIEAEEGWSLVSENEKRITFRTQSLTIVLENGKLTAQGRYTPDIEKQTQDVRNQLARGFSKQVVKIVAKKYSWTNKPAKDGLSGQYVKA